MPETSPRLPFEIDDAIDPTLVTGRAGVPLVIELFRQLGVAQVLDTHVPVKQRQRGLPPSQLVESLIALWTSGGDRCQDLTTLREDQVLATLLGYPLPAATTVRDFLEAFHVENGPLWQAGPHAAIPEESAPLAGLGQATRTLVAGVILLWGVGVLVGVLSHYNPLILIAVVIVIIVLFVKGSQSIALGIPIAVAGHALMHLFAFMLRLLAKALA